MRRHEPWRRYRSLIEQLSLEAGDLFIPQPDAPQPREQELVDAFSRRLTVRHRDERAEALLRSLGVTHSYYRQHLRYVAFWPGILRQHLAEGASLRLLEGVNKEQAHKLSGLALTGTVAQQQAILRRALQDTRPSSPERGLGWLAPAEFPDPIGSPLTALWTFDPRGLPKASVLHPLVVRALLRSTLKAPGGTVIDPLAGTGVVGVEASKLGHWAWVSDLTPEADFVRQHDLLAGGEENDLASFIGDRPEHKADLLVLHPPLRDRLMSDNADLEAFVEAIVDRSAGAVKLGGKVALIVDVLEAPQALETLTRVVQEVLQHSAPPTRGQGEYARPSFGLVSHFVAVARDGSQGWHILVAQNGEAEDSTAV